VFLEQLGMQVDDIPRALAEGNHVDAAGKGLQVDTRTDFSAETIHHIESGFVAVEKQALEARSAAGLDIGNPRVHGSPDSGHKVIS